MARDGSSGGLIRLVTVDKDGAHKRTVQGAQLPLVLGDMPEPGTNAATVVW